MNLSHSSIDHITVLVIVTISLVYSTCDIDIFPLRFKHSCALFNFFLLLIFFGAGDHGTRAFVDKSIYHVRHASA